MRNKTVAGVLAFTGGMFGLHRFYLGQIGLGIFYCFFFWITWLVGIIDAIVLLSMDNEVFDRKYNKNQNWLDHEEQEHSRNQNRKRERRTNRRKQTAPTRPARPVASTKTRRPVNNPYRKSGIEKFKDYDYEEAIVDFEKALELDPQDVASHFNLACAFSLTENKDRAFYHLDRAVALGFKDTEIIKSRDHLAFIRIQPEFLQFEANGFRLAGQLSAPKNDLLESIPTPKNQQNNNLLDQLQRLAELKEKGLLTAEEFQVQKEKLLR